MKMSDEKPESGWLVECSDDEKYDPTKQGQGVWEPMPDDIQALYERLAKGEALSLEWKCRGRRSPTPERKEEEMDACVIPEEEPKPEEKTIATEFDFDEEFGGTSTPNPVTPRRTPGSSKTPRTQKRVARLDKIMDDIRRHKKINEQAEKSSMSVIKPKTPPAGDTQSTPQRPLSRGGMSPKKIS